jgi:ABC-2 type transport system ATP-binding protein
MTHPPALSLHGLTKRYGKRSAVDELTFELPRGVVAGFIGPNGAGKTTTMAMLLGLVRPSGGDASVLGEPLAHPERYLPRVGALVEGPALWPGLTGVQNLTVVGRLGGHDLSRIPAVLDLVGLRDRGADRFGEYSLGMKQRLGVAAAILGEPELLILDEPTNGLDPAGISDMRELIGRLSGADRTVLVSSHLLAELEHVCDWLLVIDHGRLVYAGDAQAFQSQGIREVVLGPLDTDDLLALADIVANTGFDAGRQGDLLVVSDIDGHDPRGLAATLNAAAANGGIALAEVHVRRPTLESSYLQTLEGDQR